MKVLEELQIYKEMEKSIKEEEERFKLKLEEKIPITTTYIDPFIGGLTVAKIWPYIYIMDASTGQIISSGFDSFHIVNGALHGTVRGVTSPAHYNPNGYQDTLREHHFEITRSLREHYQKEIDYFNRYKNLDIDKDPIEDMKISTCNDYEDSNYKYGVAKFLIFIAVLMGFVLFGTLISNWR